MKFLVSSISFISFIAFSYSTEYRYDRYSGNATNLEVYTAGNNTNCTIVVRHCAPHEGSRVDGTCNNYHYPTRGSARGPYLRLLNPDYSNDKRDIRKNRDGGDLPSARRVRTTLQTDGRVIDKHEFNIAAYHYLEFIHLDVSLLNGPLDYLVNRQYCCQPEGQLDPRCKPIPVPNDDPYLRVTDIRCLNFSRAETFQDDGCINDTYTPEQINFQTPVIDLSTIYGVDESGLNAVRQYRHGLLKLEYRDFRHVPLANLSSNSTDFSSLLSLIDPASLPILNQQMLNLTMSNSSMFGNMTMQNRQNMIINFAMLNATMFNNSSMWQNNALNDKQMLGSMFNLQNMQGVLSMLQSLTKLNPQTLRSLTALNSDKLGDLPMSNQQMLENLSKLNPQMLANLIRLNPKMLGNLATLGNLPSTSRRRRQATVPISLPTTGGLNDAILTPVLQEVDSVTPMLMGYINMTYLNRSICLQNMNNETRCYVFGVPVAGNFDLRTTTLAIFFTREHNRLARALHKLNPCWKDDRLFKVARQINIATATNILMYELLPMIMGRKNMLKYGLISEHVQHITAYDEDAVPLVYAEFEIAVRYYHTMLDGRIKLYDENYHYDSEFSVSNTTYRQSLIEDGKNFEKINRGTFYQHAARIDDIQDPEISEKYYGDLQRAADLPSLDLQRGRDLGIRGYNDYRHICGMKPARKFEDFADVMDHEKIESLKRLYDRIEDIDLLAGIMSENFIPHTYVSPTLFCIMTKQLQLYRFADRFWFERGDQVHSLTLPQLHEVRKTNIARFACDNADAIKFIQPRAFENVGPHNQHVPCTHIPGLDITKWKDNSCYNDKHHYRSQKHNSNDELNFNNWYLKNNQEDSIYERNRNGELETTWPMPKGNKVNIENSSTMSNDSTGYKKDSKREDLIHWSMNLETKNTDKQHNKESKQKEELHRALFDHGGKQKEEMVLLVNKPGPHRTHWTINKYGKHEGAIYGPTKKDDKMDLLVLKHWSMAENNAKYGWNIPLIDYNGKYRGDNYPHTMQDNGKYDDKPDWPVKNKNQFPQMPHLNGPLHPSTSHQSYQPDTTDFAPYIQRLLSVT